MSKRDSGGPRRARGDTVPVQGETRERSPRTPHERDESADSQTPGEPSARHVGSLAHEDLRAGRVDTDKGPVLDATYEKLRKGGERPGKKG